MGRRASCDAVGVARREAHHRSWQNMAIRMRLSLAMVLLSLLPEPATGQEDTSCLTGVQLQELLALNREVVRMLDLGKTSWLKPHVCANYWHGPRCSRTGRKRVPRGKLRTPVLLPAAFSSNPTARPARQGNERCGEAAHGNRMEKPAGRGARGMAGAAQRSGPRVLSPTPSPTRSRTGCTTPFRTGGLLIRSGNNDPRLARHRHLRADAAAPRRDSADEDYASASSSGTGKSSLASLD